MNNFQIIETREKSYKLQARNGVTFFIMKKWMRADGSLTPKGLEALASADAGEVVKYEAKPYILKVARARYIDTKYGEKLLAECYDGSKMWLNPSKATKQVTMDDSEQISIEYGYAQWLKSERKDGWTQIKGLAS